MKSLRQVNLRGKVAIWTTCAIGSLCAFAAHNEVLGGTLAVPVEP